MTGAPGSEVAAERVRGGSSLLGMLDSQLEAASLALPICPESAAHIDRQLARAGTESQRLFETLSGDPALAASVLREANGPEFDGLKRVAGLPAALRRLGEERVRDLVTSMSASARFDGADPVLSRALRETWKRSLAVALVTPLIAERTGDATLAPEARLLGLLSDVGVVFLISALEARCAACGDRPRLTDAAKWEVLDQLQGAYGIRLLERWNFPPDMLAVLAGRPSGRDPRRQSLFLRMARQVVASIGLPPAGSGERGADDNDLWELAEALELNYVDVAALQVHAEDVVAALDAEVAARR